MNDLTSEGEAVVKAINSRIAKLAGALGIVNISALFGIFVYLWGVADTTARQVAQSRVDEISSELIVSVQSSLASANSIIQSAVSDAATEIGNARQQVGVTEAQLDSVQSRIDQLQEALSSVFSDDSGVEEDEVRLIIDLLEGARQSPQSANVAALVNRLDADINRLETVIPASVSVETRVQNIQGFNNVPEWTEIPNSSGATYCGLAVVDDDSPAGSCHIGRNGGSWLYRTGGGSGANICAARCITVTAVLE